MKIIGYILLICLFLYLAPTLLGVAVGVISTVGVVLLLAALAYGITFLIAGSIVTAGLVAAIVLAVATIGAWLPLLLIGLVVYLFIKCTVKVLR
ncbi:hypothetical protein CWE15_07740 [Aliidiomarina taiwanensis]|uniref:Uncharacterized protein n=1 Tax=Aliidiomarina taiwanensis TaxID=946228 RepID=A0A432X161_9GAMM|nr:hypothetical protein [Aliidiomarina taiwanensis]RUO40029.1 hypothetical protein CWE15_07740 [Aliidiomarina taiwanensis]